MILTDLACAVVSASSLRIAANESPRDWPSATLTMP